MSISNAGRSDDAARFRVVPGLVEFEEPDNVKKSDTTRGLTLSFIIDSISGFSRVFFHHYESCILGCLAIKRWQV